MTSYSNFVGIFGKILEKIVLDKFWGSLPAQIDSNANRNLTNSLLLQNFIFMCCKLWWFFLKFRWMSTNFSKCSFNRFPSIHRKRWLLLCAFHSSISNQFFMNSKSHWMRSFQSLLTDGVWIKLTWLITPENSCFSFEYLFLIFSYSFIIMT